MLASYAIGLGAMVVIAVAWVAVQISWRRTFPGECSDSDALASRIGCHGCDGTRDCERQRGAAEEELP